MVPQLLLVRRMSTHLDIRSIGPLVAGVLLTYMGLRHWYLRRLQSRLFVDASCDDPELDSFREALEEVNRECRTHSFFASRFAKTQLSGHPISLIQGWVVVPMAEGANSERRIFAIAHRDESDWLRHFSDVFDLAFSGSVWSVFWVKLPTLMRLTRRGSEPRDSVRSTP
jgi:hypothetical protein